MRQRIGVWALVWCHLAMLASPHVGRAQSGRSTEAQPIALRWRRAERIVLAPSAFVAPEGRPAPWWAPIASGVLPGGGQFALKQQRSVAYLAAEGFLILQYASAQRDGDRDRVAYRALAADVARKPFGGTRPVGPWEYYEAMEKFLASGVFDRVAGGAVDPETDESTYNGARWLLARQTYWRDARSAPATTSAEYQRALAFYLERAVRDEYRWSWRDAQLQQDLYRQTIASANRQYQRAVTMTGILALNHLASLIDAYVSVRVRRFGGVQVAGVRTEYVPLGDPVAGRGVWTTQLRLVPVF